MASLQTYHPVEQMPVWESGVYYPPGTRVSSPMDRYKVYVKVNNSPEGTQDPFNSMDFDPVLSNNPQVRTIYRIQRGRDVMANGQNSMTVTLPVPVDAARAVLYVNGGSIVTTAGASVVPSVYLNTGGTQVIANIPPTSASNGQGYIAWQVVEYY